MRLYVFGDQTFDVQPYLKELSRSENKLALKDFLEKSYEVIRKEIFNLPRDVRDSLPRFGCINDILLQDQCTQRCVPLDMAVTCMFQIGSFIRVVNDHDYNGSNIRLLGLCTGALAAAAVSCSRNTTELISLGMLAIKAAFRIGMRVVEAKMQIAPSNSRDRSWSKIFIGSSDVASAVEEFLEQNAFPRTRQTYVSAAMPNAVAVSGPPESLAKFTDFVALRKLSSFELPIHAPYHAAHLYSFDDIEAIMGTLVSDDDSIPLGYIPIISGTGFKVPNARFQDVLRAAMGQILLQRIHWDFILKDLESCLRDMAPKSLDVLQIGTTIGQTIYGSVGGFQNTTLSSVQSLPVIPSKVDVLNSACGKSKIAITGMSGRFPEASNDQEFWNILYQGLDVHKSVPALHWDAQTHVDVTGVRKNTSATPYGCWLDDPAAFDARFFNISPREAPQIDPAQRLALMTAFEACEQSGLVPDATPSTRRDRVGVFYGVTSNDWMETNSAQDIGPYFIPGGNRAFVPGRVNYFYKFGGPSYAIDTACSSSLAGIHIACNALWQKDIDTAIAGGTNILTNPDFTAGLDRGHFLSRTGNCRTFDDSADGYCRGEGVATVVLKRLEDAIADNDPVLGVIVSAATNHSAEADSITRPHSGAQSELFGKILKQGGVSPFSVGYVEMHGTGTQVGDTIEMCSVLDTFAPPLDRCKGRRENSNPLYLGSAKANIGHGEAASGVSSLIKSLLMLQNNIIVPHCGIKTKINHRFPTDLQERNVHIATEPTPWKRNSDPAKPRRIFVNNFSAAGGNSALLLEDAPLQREAPHEPHDSRTHHPVAISAKNGISLQGNLRSMLRYLEYKPETPVGQLSYTTTARRMHHQHRVMLTGKTTEDISKQIETALEDETGMKRPAAAPKIVFTFTGQGAQYPGMGKELYQNFSIFRTAMNRLDQIAQRLGFPSFLHVINSEDRDFDNFTPLDVQLAGVCMQIALCRLWSAWNIAPVAVLGHSLGEYAALNIAGVLSDADTVYIVGLRAALLQKNCIPNTHSMLVIRGSVEEILDPLKNSNYEISCINSPTETVISGSKENMLEIQRTLADAGFKSTMLKVPFAFHSSQVDPILEDFESLASGLVFSKPKIPIISPLDGKVVDVEGIFGARYLTRHTREPVNMINTLYAARESHLITDKTIVLEIGPHSAIAGMVRQVIGAQIECVPSCQRGRPAFLSLTAALKTIYTAGAEIDWIKYHSDFKASHKVLQLPAYSWDLKDYWLQYVNDWSLRKGDALIGMQKPTALESTTIHRVVKEVGDSDKASIVVEADIIRKDLSSLVQGHEVDGIPLCTPSVYADIALSLGAFLLKKYRPDEDENLVNVSDMTISKALILQVGATQQLLQAHAEADWKMKELHIRFLSFDKFQKLQEHSRCVVRYQNRAQLDLLQKNVAVMKQKMKALRDGTQTGASARFNRPMVYRAIRPLAQFHKDYRAIDEIVLNSDTLEASSQLNFGDVKRGGEYHTHPAIIDSLTQSCGFTMNCNDYTDLDKEVFMNHGWGSFQIFEALNLEKTYTTYTQMVEGKEKLWHGDVVILDGEKVVAFFGQVAIQKVPRRILKIVLASEQGNASRKKPRHKGQAKDSPALDQVIKSKGDLLQKTVDSGNASKFSQALSILADESGLAVAEFEDHTNFSEAGVDSLLSIVITSRFKDELDLDLDFNTFLYDCPTVAALKRFVQGESNDLYLEATPSLCSQSSTSKTPNPTGPVTLYTRETMGTPDFTHVLDIVAEESGIAAAELTNDTSLTEAGVDSLLSLVIASRLQTELGLDIQTEDLLIECSTIEGLKKFIMGAKQEKPIQPESIRPSGETVSLGIRENAVEEYVQRYTSGFTAPQPSSISSAYNTDAKVVLVTGGTGSLGGHLVDQIARMQDVKTVICLNREHHGSEPYDRQQKSMRDRGIRTFDQIKDKLLIFQTDSSKPRLGLSSQDYEKIANSTTHLIHNAWPMSAKRAVERFESQFQVMRNLIDLACHIVSRRPKEFKFSFEMISSIGVVGHYGLGNGKEKTVIPEESSVIGSVLPNGYSDAKWVCERMLQKTLRMHPDNFRAFVVRLGQIAGSKTSGYWNPMEHFAFLIKSSQTLGALPDVPGTVYWTPVNDVAGTCVDLVLSKRTPHAFYHVENPIGQPWRDVNVVLADALRIPLMVPFEEWTERVRTAGQRNNPAATLLDFLDDNYLRLSCGQAILDVKNTLAHSKTLAAVGPVSEEVIRKYVHVWKEIGFLS